MATLTDVQRRDLSAAGALSDPHVRHMRETLTRAGVECTLVLPDGQAVRVGDGPPTFTATSRLYAHCGRRSPSITSGPHT